TAAGRRLADSARRLLGDVVALEDELRGHSAGKRDVLRLTTECYTCYDWLPPLLQRFEKRFPDVEVQIVVEATRSPVAALRAGEVDLALVTGPVGSRDIETRDLFEDELLLAVAPSHRLAARRCPPPRGAPLSPPQGRPRRATPALLAAGGEQVLPDLPRPRRRRAARG